MWKVMFSEYGTMPGDEKTVVIFPTNTGWNDFGYKYQAVLRIPIKRAIIDFHIKVIPIKQDILGGDLQTWVKWLIETDNSRELRPKNKNYPNFISLFSSVENYKNLASNMESEEYESLLKGINEINAIQNSSALSFENYQTLVTSPQFTLGVIRESGPYMAFRFGYYSARRLSPPGDARIPFIFSTILEGNTTPHTINFNYKDNDIFSDRVQCLIGINGSGKTSFLKNLICSINSRINIESKNISVLSDKENKTITNEVNPNTIINDIPIFSRVVAYSSDPHNILPRKVDLTGSFEYLYSDMGLEKNNNLTMMLADIIRNDIDFIGEDSRYTLLKKVLQNIVPLSMLLIPITNTISDSIVDEHGEHWISIGALRGGEQRKLEVLGLFDSKRDLKFQSSTSLNMPLSSGQKIYFQFATHFLTVVRQGTLVIIDEPETHLHPNLVTSFMNLLYLVLEATASAAIIATHSVYVVRETPSHCVHIIKTSGDGEVSISNTYANTLGANISSLSNFVFSDPLVESFNSRIAKEAAKSGRPLTEIIEQYKDLMSIDMLMSIREIINSKEKNDA